MAIKFVTGDPFSTGDQPTIIAHFCDDSGDVSQGFFPEISEFSPEPKLEYLIGLGLRRRDGHPQSKTSGLGSTQIVVVRENLWVANLLAQNVGDRSSFVDSALGTCLNSLALHAKIFKDEFGKAVIHFPSVCFGPKGHLWPRIQNIFYYTLVKGLSGEQEVAIYNLPGLNREQAPIPKQALATA